MTQVEPTSEVRKVANGASAHRSLTIDDQVVHFADSRNMIAVPNGHVRLFMTSPPYWNLKKYGGESEIGHSDYETYLADLNLVWDECYRCAAKDAVLIVNVNSRRHKKTFYPIAIDIAARMRGWRLWDHVIWYIPNALPQPNHYMERILDNKYESCLVFTKDGSSSYTFNKPRVPQKYREADPRSHNKNAAGRCLGNVIRIPAYRPPNVKNLGYHVAAYPEELAAFFVHCYSNRGDTVLDPFLGSGTTLKVARVMGRLGIGFEANQSNESLITSKVREHWKVPDWRDIDVLHSTTAETGMSKPRKIQYRDIDADGLFGD